MQTNARRPSVEETAPGVYRVAVSASPHEGKANAAVIKALAEHLSIPKSHITIHHGHKSRTKVVEIAE